MDSNKEIVRLRSYKSMWNYPKKIYSLEKLKLLVPIVLEDALFFVLGILIMYLITKALPFIKFIPGIIRWVFAPYGIMKFFTKKKFDGKKPHKFLIGYIEYMINPKTLGRFQPVQIIEKPIEFTSVLYRARTAVNMTEMALKPKKGGKKKNV